uniref:Uncharacterized protein n=1 Tax=Aplanochytrium stocchinoi TaxID=215587 RepID=A0A7S3PRG4_9STRA|mmetsp:Transcript_12414/g.15398  ORF Transcript_12414/g.15398 Transcript_12414/m.15398 type:complete len:192 (-) Transcript_12414:124-699(-)|eukprot:CAMPEP_0204826744 /NCGR_PEP_ID=MMETSP1346-20131115/4371_1 /ASSEMBLY_ACC=CAM_ASM_000771 /TAXON_ID=215587 /ORGANISM="Aplanochytrium stocchinoi, Strain GSBS06" /LENGTH=191 /DNA_ID=CAMNT_0051954889 /DNA_START=239 /DNA_END=814 /DNA_ORIENTATION=+
MVDPKDQEKEIVESTEEEEARKRKREEEENEVNKAAKTGADDEPPPPAVASLDGGDKSLVEISGRLIHMGNLFDKKNKDKDVPCIVVNKSNILKDCLKGYKLVKLVYMDPVTKYMLISQDIKSYADFEIVVRKLQAIMKSWKSLNGLLDRSKKKEIPRWKVLEETCTGTWEKTPGASTGVSLVTSNGTGEE